MSRPDEHAELRELLTDAVSDVEPAYRLDAIRARTRRPHPRRTWLTVGGTVLVAASVITAVNLANDGDRPGKTPTAKDPRTATTALYFVGDTPAGPRLYREFQQVSGGPLGALEAITKEGGPTDPDYGTIWPEDLFTSVTVTEDAIEVELGEWTGPDYDIGREAVTAYVQAVVYTAQAATGEDLPVQFTEGGEPTGEPLGTIRGTEPIERLPHNEILSLVSISDPAEGTVISAGDSFVARGRANSFEANVLWEILRGDRVVVDGFVTADGWGDRLHEWQTDPIDVIELEPGHYTFVAMTDDPSGGAEGFGPFTDTRTIIVE